MFVRVGKLAEVFAEVEPKTPAEATPWRMIDWVKVDGCLEVWIGRLHVIWSSLPVKTRD